jgi:hypothetical protein
MKIKYLYLKDLLQLVIDYKLPKTLPKMQYFKYK